MTEAHRSVTGIMKRGLFAGIAGGVAEIAWVSLYAAISGANAAVVARGVTTAAGVTALLPAAPTTAGIAVHMMLAALLGVVLSGLWQSLAGREYGTNALYGFMVAALAFVWAMNFFVVLPTVDPSFVHLLPYSVSLVSKLLFGVAAAETLRRTAFQEKTAPAPSRRT
jgi:hypothetical protein